MNVADSMFKNFETYVSNNYQYDSLEEEEDSIERGLEFDGLNNGLDKIELEYDKVSGVFDVELKYDDNTKVEYEVKFNADGDSFTLTYDGGESSTYAFDQNLDSNDAFKVINDTLQKKTGSTSTQDSSSTSTQTDEAAVSDSSSTSSTESAGILSEDSSQATLGPSEATIDPQTTLTAEEKTKLEALEKQYETLAYTREAKLRAAGALSGVEARIENNNQSLDLQKQGLDKMKAASLAKEGAEVFLQGSFEEPILGIRLDEVINKYTAAQGGSNYLKSAEFQKDMATADISIQEGERVAEELLTLAKEDALLSTEEEIIKTVEETSTDTLNMTSTSGEILTKEADALASETRSTM
jgi:hypothetical protein